jgi:formylglycine-generating enzyme required for sulfatase activity
MHLLDLALLFLAAFAAGAFAVSLAGAASAKIRKPQRPEPERSTQAEPVSLPQQIIPVKGVQPLTPELEQSLKPKDSFKECDDCPEMVVVPGGTFMMGTPTSEPDHNDDEGPQHKVAIGYSFAVGRFAITFDEWDACVAGGGCNGYEPDDRGFGRGRRPVFSVGWDEAHAYLAWLGRKSGRSYRLLTEAEREYVTRAGTTTPFWFGNTITSQQAAYQASTPYNGGPRGVDADKTMPVDSFAPNKFGLYQVHGNIPEWTEDCYKKNYIEAPVDGSPMLEGKCDQRVTRGGSWKDHPWFLRSGGRGRSTPFGHGSEGFRVARTLNIPR